MPSPFDGVMPDHHRVTLTECLKSCHGTAEMIQCLKDCGIPMDEQAQRNDAQRQVAETLKSRLYPHSP